MSSSTPSNRNSARVRGSWQRLRAQSNSRSSSQWETATSRTAEFASKRPKHSSWSLGEEMTQGGPKVQPQPLTDSQLPAASRAARDRPCRVEGLINLAGNSRFSEKIDLPATNDATIAGRSSVMCFSRCDTKHRNCLWLIFRTQTSGDGDSGYAT